MLWKNESEIAWRVMEWNPHGKEGEERRDDLEVYCQSEVKVGTRSCEENGFNEKGQVNGFKQNMLKWYEEWQKKWWWFCRQT